ncbi:MAG: hypothetical protein ACI3Z9_00325 [Candidatus Onthomorpha sp.]
MHICDFWKSELDKVTNYGGITDFASCQTKNRVVYDSPVNDNFGKRNGECAYRSLEECCRSYGKKQYNAEYWMELYRLYKNETKIQGVDSSIFENFVAESGVFVAKRLSCVNDTIIGQSKCDGIPTMFQNDKRVLIALDTKRAKNYERYRNMNLQSSHMALVKRIMIFNSGFVQLTIAETDPSWTFPRYITYKSTDGINDCPYFYFSFWPIRI